MNRCADWPDKDDRKVSNMVLQAWCRDDGERKFLRNLGHAIETGPDVVGQSGDGMPGLGKV